MKSVPLFDPRLAMQRTERFALVLTEKEKSLVELLAQLEGGLSQAAMLRRLIHKAAQEHDIPPQPIPTVQEINKTRVK